MADNKTVILDIQVNANDALKNIVAAKDAIAQLKDEQKQLEEQLKNGQGTQAMKERLAMISVEIKDLNGVIRENSKEIDNQIKAYKNAEGSLAKTRAQIANLKAQYDSLSEAERDSARGKELIDKLNALNNSAKAAQFQMQGLPKGMSNLAASMSQVSPMAGRATAAIGKINLAFKALIANPVALVISAIVLAIKKLSDSFKKNDEAMTRLQTAMAPFKAILSALEKGFQAIVDVISKVVEWYGKLYGAILSVIPGMKEQVQAQEDIVQSTDRLEDAEREYTINHAKRENEISELRNKALQSEKYTAEERRSFLEQALKLEKEDVNERRKNANETLRIAEKKALAEIGYTKMTAKAWAQLSDEQKDNITQLRANVIGLDAEFNNATRRMTSQLNSFDKEINKEAEEAAKTATENAKKRAENEKKAMEELEDLTIAAMKDLQAKEEAQIKVENTRKINTLKDRLKNEKDLTLKTREAINQQITLLEADLQVKLGEISKKYNEETLKSRLSAQQKFLEQLLKNAQGDVTEYQVMLSDIIYETQIQAVEAQEELANDLKTKSFYGGLIEALQEAQRKARIIIESDAKMAKMAILEANEAIMMEIRDNEWLGLFHDNEVEKTKIFEQQARNRLAVAEAEYNRLATMSKEEREARYQDEEYYQNALLKAQNAVVKSQNDVAEAVKNTNIVIADQKNQVIESYKTIADSTNAILGSFQSIFDTLAESNEDYAAFSKALALMQILVSTAISIANAIQGATAAGAATGAAAPFTTPAFITEMVAIVSGAIASAMATLKKAEVPKYASGGLVGSHTTTRTDDTVDAKLSAGEYVVRSSVVKAMGVDFFNQLNGTKGKPHTLRFAQGGIVPSITTMSKVDGMNYDLMRDMFMEVVKEINPVVSVKEINSAQNMVKIKESVAGY